MELAVSNLPNDGLPEAPPSLLRTSQKCTNIDDIDRNKKSDANQRQTKGRFS